MSGNNHTPTPWIATNDYESNGIGIAQVGSFWIETESETEVTASEKDDAAHIVKCVNCHDDLLDFVKYWLSRQGSDDNYMTARSKAVIDKAEGRPNDRINELEEIRTANDTL